LERAYDELGLSDRRVMAEAHKTVQLSRIATLVAGATNAPRGAAGEILRNAAHSRDALEIALMAADMILIEAQKELVDKPAGEAEAAARAVEAQRAADLARDADMAAQLAENHANALANPAAAAAEAARLRKEANRLAAEAAEAVQVTPPGAAAPQKPAGTKRASRGS
jgi:hypothetical protein